MSREYCFSCGLVGCESDYCIPKLSDDPCSKCGGMMEIFHECGKIIAECKDCEHQREEIKNQEIDRCLDSPNFKYQYDKISI